MQTFNKNSSHFNIYISVDRREAFWRTLIALGKREQEKGEGSPFDIVHASTVVVETIISLSLHQDEANQQISIQVGEAAQLPSIVTNDTLWLSINQKRREQFWDALVILGQQEMRKRGERDPFEAISISSLITAKILEVGGFAANVDLETVARPMLNRSRETLTISTTTRKRQQFWNALNGLARLAHTSADNPFTGVNKSALIADIIIAQGETIARSVPIEETFLVERLDFSSPVGTTLSPPQSSAAGRTLVLYLNTENRERFWESLSILGRQALQQMENNPFTSVSVSALLADTIIDLWETLERKNKGEMQAHEDTASIVKNN